MGFLITSILVAILGAIIFFFGFRIVLYVVLSCLFSWWLCDITPMKEYAWYSGIWHGFFFIGNFIRSIFSDALYKADFYTTGYNIWWWISTVISVVGALFGGRKS